MDPKRKLDKVYENTAIIVAVIIVLLAIIRVIQSPFEKSLIPDEYFPMGISLLVALILPFVIKKLIEINAQVRKLPSYFFKINSKGSSSEVNTFGSQSEFFDTLLGVTLHSHRVYTCMYSAPPKKLGNSARNYFSAVHKKLRKKTGKDKFLEFKRIATVGTKEKANWLLEILYELHDVACFSLAIKDIENSSYLVSIHTCFGANGGSLMLWPTMRPDPSGIALLVKNLEAAKIWKGKYMLEFNNSVELKSGLDFRWNKIDEMAEKYGLLNSESYKKLTSLRLSE